jgi:TolB-like protein
VEQKDILNSWKEISYYLDRNVRTCQRWKIELGLPVHRIDKNSQHSKVFAYKSEIDEWLKEKARRKEIKKLAFLEDKRSIIGLISALALLSTILLFLLFTNRMTISPPPENLSLAVLPFENLNPSEYDEYFSAGITNEIINKLILLNKLKVIPAKSVSKYNNSSENKNQIAEELSADYILGAKIKKDDNKIRMHVQLIRTKDYKIIWSEEFEDRLENIFSIQENICRKIHEKLKLNIDQELPLLSEDGKTHDYLAYDNYLKGNHILSRLNENNSDPWKLYHQGKLYWGTSTPESNKFAISLFSQAIEIDMNFAPAYIGLAHCYSNYVNFNWLFDVKWLDKAEEVLKKAQTTSPDLPEYYSTLIEIYILKHIYFDEDKKTIAFELAEEGIKKYPNDPQLNSITGYCFYLKFGEKGNEADFVKALEYKEISFWLNPYGINNIVYAELLMLNKEFYEAIQVCNFVEKRDSSLMTKFRLGEIYYYLGDLDKSEAIFQQFNNAPLHLKNDSLLYLAMICSQKGEKDKTLRKIEEIKLIAPKEFIVNDYLYLASAYVGLGMKELGYECLRSFFNRLSSKKMRFIYLEYIDADKNFDYFREEEEFKKIIKN